MPFLGPRVPLLLVAGLVVALFGLVTFLRDRRRRATWQAYPGRVVASRLDGGQTRSQVAYVRDGREVRFWNPVTSTTLTDPVGRPVEVLVDPDDPNRAVVGGGLVGGGRWGIVLAAVGLLAAVLGATVFW